MGLIETGIVVAIIILAVIMITYYIRSKRGFLKFLFGVLSGIGTLFLVSMIMTTVGYSLSVNIFTVAICSVLGAPGVLLLVALLIV